MTNRRRALIFAGLGIALSACASGSSTRYDQQERTILSVRNDNYLDHNIYLVLQGLQRVRLGTARGLTTTRLTIPPQYVFGASVLQFLADPIGGTVSPISERVSVSAGDEVLLYIRGL